jgi:hypothetical protein
MLRRRGKVATRELDRCKREHGSALVRFSRRGRSNAASTLTQRLNPEDKEQEEMTAA